MQVNFSNQSILIVDDDNVQLKIIENFLCDFNCRLHFAQNGYEAFEIYKNKRIDLIITDLNMPRYNGIELIQKIREHNFWVPIIVVTSNLTANYFLSCANSNIQGLIEKPITKTKLEDILKRIIIYNEKANNDEEKNLNHLKLEENIFYDSDNSTIINNKEEFPLNKKERLLLELLIDNKNRVVSYKNIETVIWYYDDKVMTQDALKNVIKVLRKKISKEFIKNISGLGYKIIL